MSNVVSLFKKGSKENPGNYKLMSLTSVVGVIGGDSTRQGLYAFGNQGLVSFVWRNTFFEKIIKKLRRSM